MEMSLEKASEEYVFRRKHGKIHIKKYIGNGGKTEIPQFIGGMPVTMIGPFAFHFSAVTEVIIPDGVRCIGDLAFFHCKELKKVTILGKIDRCDFRVFCDSAIEEIEGIEFLAGIHFTALSFEKTPFYEANETLIIGDELIWCRDNSEVINVPDNIRRIGYYAFRSSKAKKIVLPKGLKKIDDLAFYEASIEEIDIPDSVEKVGYGALYECRRLKEIRLPRDFGRRIKWNNLGLSNKVINDTQINPTSDDDVLVYDNVSCIVCSDAMRYSPYRVREKQIFPKRLEYLKYAKLLLSAKVNVLRNDTFIIGIKANSAVDFPNFERNAERRFTIIFELDNAYAEVLFWLPFLPYYWRRGDFDSPQRYILTDFYERCLVNCKDGRFFDFEEYDGHILEQDIPFRIKAEIAYKRFKSNYRLTDEAKENYKRYFTFHRRKLLTALDKLQDEDMKRLFTEIL